MSKQNSPNVLIVTVTLPEGQAVLRAFETLTGHKASPQAREQRLYQVLGQVQGVRVVMALSEMGSGGLGGSQESVRLALQDWQPVAVIMVGIAFGVDPTRQQIGQVLVSEQIVPYELQRIGEQQTVIRGDKPHAAPRLINWLRHVALTLPAEQSIQFGAILSGEKLIDKQAWREELLALVPTAIGGEMEGAGLYVACQNGKTDWILLKAICDWADGKKGQNKAEQQALAAKNAADLIAHALQTMPLPGVEQRIAPDFAPDLALPPASPAAVPAAPASPAKVFGTRPGTTITSPLLDSTPPPSPPPPSLPSAGQAEEQLAELLAFCDRTEILLKLKALLQQHVGLHLLCFADHVKNRPDKLRGRIKDELAEKLPNLRLEVFAAKESYGFEDKNGISAIERFGKALCEAAGVRNEVELCQQLHASRADALLLWYYDECTTWSKASVAQCLGTACAWLESVGKLGKPAVPIVLILVLRYDTPPPTSGLFANLRRADPQKNLTQAYRQVRDKSTASVALAFDEMLILPDYSREDFRRWLKLDKVRDYLGGTLATFEDEDLLAEHFAKGSSHYSALLKFLQQHHKGNKP